MAVQEVAIIYKGFPLYSKKFLDIRDIKDDDIVTASIYSSFLRLVDCMPPKGKNGTFIKMEMARNFIHMWEKAVHVPSSLGDEAKFFIYIIEDRDMADTIMRPMMEKIIGSYVERYGASFKAIAKDGMDVSDFDKVVEKILGNLTTKQYRRFFDLWDKPRLVD
nr:hypothetical protein [Candidatus Sigynarchaeota archaeon]